ncbi:MAG: GDP-mannose 4,6-dehydratase [Firmicutes bacterium]|nr:GDP-mannose 4,6-dehydratase [Bacillota bacterium]MCL5290175.1 GDP-mannose 4,6-dehydratase [Bacillota bacterium]
MDSVYLSINNLYAGKKVLITGGLGFIGSNLAHKLVGLGAEVTLVDCLVPDQGGNLFNIQGIEDKVKINISDMGERNSINHLVRKQNYIFNLAGQTSHIDSMRHPFTDLEMNCRAHLTLLEACRENNPEAKIVYAGTRQIYGKPDYLPLDENHPLRPPDVNGIHKVAAEWYHVLYNKVYGLRTTSLRLTNTYGPRQIIKHNRGGFTGWFIRLAIGNEVIKIFGDGSQLRDFNYVDDVVEAFLLAGVDKETEGEVFNLGAEKPHTLLEFVDVLTGVCGSGQYELVPFPKEREQIDVGSVYSSIDKIKKALGWSPKIFLEEGLRQTIQYLKENKDYYWQ